MKDYEEQYLSLNDNDRKVFYLNVRQSFNDNLSNFNYDIYDEESIIRSAQIIFMNKTCFNGLYRVNKKGKFNVPHGKYKNPTICNENNLNNVHHILKGTTIVNASYLESEELIDDKSFVYLDPPYRPLNKTSSFTDYSNCGFDDNNQIELANYYKKIHAKGAKVMLSNSDPHNVDVNDNFFDDLYSEFNIYRILAKRSINSNANKRGAINELLITNY